MRETQTRDKLIIEEKSLRDFSWNNFQMDEWMLESIPYDKTYTEYNTGLFNDLH